MTQSAPHPAVNGSPAAGPPPAGPPSVAPPRRRSSRRRLALAAVLLLAAAAVGPGAVLAARYQPFTSDTFGWQGGLVTMEWITEAPWSDATAGGHTLYRVAYRDGATASWAFTLRNDGPVGVTVTGIDADWRGSIGLVQVTGVQIARPGARCCIFDGGGLLPFRPFALPAGGRRLIVVRGRFTGCERYSAGTYEQHGLQRIDFRLLGVQRTAWVDVGAVVEVQSPADEQCPRPRPS